jgi:hypothetical protein
MSTPPSIRALHAGAVRLVNAKFAALPAEVRESLDLEWDWLDDEIEYALKRDDELRARSAIESFCGHWLRVFERSMIARPDPRTRV